MGIEKETASSGPKKICQWEAKKERKKKTLRRHPDFRVNFAHFSVQLGSMLPRDPCSSLSMYRVCTVHGAGDADPVLYPLQAVQAVGVKTLIDCEANSKVEGGTLSAFSAPPMFGLSSVVSTFHSLPDFPRKVFAFATFSSSAHFRSCGLTSALASYDALNRLLNKTLLFNITRSQQHCEESFF